MVVSGSIEIPVLDALVIVHYDHLSERKFVRREIERRKKIYSYKKKPIHNLSIADAKPDIEAQLDRCVENLRQYRYRRVELVGTSWYICVQGLYEKIAFLSSSIRPIINYDATDLVQNYQRLLAEGIHSHEELPAISIGAFQRYINDL